MLNLTLNFMSQTSETGNDSGWDPSNSRQNWKIDPQYPLHSQTTTQCSLHDYLIHQLLHKEA